MHSRANSILPLSWMPHNVPFLLTGPVFVRDRYADLPAAGVSSLVEADGRNHVAALGVLTFDTGLPGVPSPLPSA